MLAKAGVSLAQVNTAGITVPLTSRSVAKN